MIESILTGLVVLLLSLMSAITILHSRDIKRLQEEVSVLKVEAEYAETYFKGHVSALHASDRSLSEDLRDLEHRVGGIEDRMPKEK